MPQNSRKNILSLSIILSLVMVQFIFLPVVKNHYKKTYFQKKGKEIKRDRHVKIRTKSLLNELFHRGFLTAGNSDLKIDLTFVFDRYIRRGNLFQTDDINKGLRAVFQIEHANANLRTKTKLKPVNKLSLIWKEKDNLIKDVTVFKGLIEGKRYHLVVLYSLGTASTTVRENSANGDILSQVTYEIDRTPSMENIIFGQMRKGNKIFSGQILDYKISVSHPYQIFIVLHWLLWGVMIFFIFKIALPRLQDIFHEQTDVRLDQKVIALIQNVTGVFNVQPTADLVKEVGISDEEKQKLIWALKEEFDLDFTDQKIKSMRSAQKIIDHIRERYKAF
ncbi:MAG: hypothetical protein QNL04_01060 [SAR324 cluster bacterium]|nr:hypothetical protein [SAR324 cluster bacterium]